MRAAIWIGIVWVGFVSGGATCARRDPGPQFPPPPPVLKETPTVERLTAVVNRTDSIRQLSTNSATVDVLSMTMPELSATINLRRDRNFRLRARLPLVMGSGLDLGSNDEVFWFEVPEAVSRTLYYARHDEYRQQLDRAILPVDPTWLIEALGLVHIDPERVVQGPVRRPDGKLELRSTIATPAGVYQRVCYIQHPGGYVTHQILYGPDGRPVATAEASNHRYYEAERCVLPHRVKVELAPAGGPPLTMQIDVGGYAVNQLLSDDPTLFDMPQTAAQSVDLTRIGGLAAGSGARPRAAAADRYSTRSDASLPLRGVNY